MKNIWIINQDAIPPAYGGLNRHYYFSKYLSENNYNVRIFTSSAIHNTSLNILKGRELWCERVEDDVPYTFVRSTQYSGHGISRIFGMFYFPFNVLRASKNFEKPDLIYTSSPPIVAVLFAQLLAKKLKVPCFVEIRDLWPESIVDYLKISKKNLLIRILYRMEKSIYKKADRLIFTMEGGKAYIQDKRWESAISMDKIIHLNNGVDLPSFNQNLQICKTDDPDLEDDSFKVIYIGSIRHANNLRLLVDAARIVQNSGEAIKFLVYGDGPDRMDLEEYCQENRILNILFKGRVEKKYIPYILSKAGCNILNYKPVPIWKYGGSQNKLFEYLACGKPIISNITMGFSLIERYNCGISLDQPTPQEYAQTIINFSKMDQEQYEEICNNALFVSRKYDYRKIVDELMVHLNKYWESL